MYLGMIMMLGGVASWFGSLPFVAATAAYFLVIQRVFCPYEERVITSYSIHYTKLYEEAEEAIS